MKWDLFLATVWACVLGRERKGVVGDMESLRALSLRRVALPGTDQLLHIGIHGQIFFMWSV